MLKWGFIVGEKYSSRTDVADILKDVLPTYVVKRVTSYMAHPLAGLSREMGEQYFNLRVMQNLRAVQYKIIGCCSAPRASSRCKSEYLREVGYDGRAWRAENTPFKYLADRKENIHIMNNALSASRHYASVRAGDGAMSWYWCMTMNRWALYPLLHKNNTKKQILDYATEKNIKLSMSWTKTKMLMVFNSVYGA
tara:strand:- start:2580 stop:3161 length:582 start_codon:yes stop_codon:yes gene_type:complete